MWQRGVLPTQGLSLSGPSQWVRGKRERGGQRKDREGRQTVKMLLCADNC